MPGDIRRFYGNRPEPTLFPRQASQSLRRTPPATKREDILQHVDILGLFRSDYQTRLTISHEIGNQNKAVENDITV